MRLLTRLEEAFEEYSLLLFSKQYIADDEHIAFTEHFGEVESPRISFGSYHHRPSVNAVINFDKEGNLYEANEPRARFRKGQRLSHTDGSYKSIPSIASILRACIVPPEGATHNLQVLEVLGMPYQQTAENIFLKVQQFITMHTRVVMKIKFLSDEEAQKYPPVRHPMMRENLLTRKSSLCEFLCSLHRGRR